MDWGWSQCGQGLCHRRALCRCCPPVSYCLSGWSHCPDSVCQNLHIKREKNQSALYDIGLAKILCRSHIAYIQRAGVRGGCAWCPLSCWSTQMFCSQHWDLASSHLETWET